MRGGVGDRTWRPATVSDLHDPYRLGVGQSELDLTQLDLASAGRTRVEIRQGVGHLLVIVPDNVVVRVVADANAGEVLLPGQHSVNGTDLSERVVLPEDPRRRPRSSSWTPSSASGAWRCVVKRHDLDLFSLVAGLVFLAVAVGHLLDVSTGSTSTASTWPRSRW